MLSAREVGLVAQRELYRNIRSTKGIAMFALFFLGGMLFSVLVSTFIQFLLHKLADKAGMTTIPDDIQRQFFEQYLEEVYGSEKIAKHIGSAPAVLYFLFQGTLFFLPVLVLPVGFDQIAGEVQHRTIRYSAGRATRASIVVGKALGVWGVISVMVLVLHFVVWIFVLVKGMGTPAQVVSWGGRFWVYTCFCAAAYVGFATVVSSLFRTPIVALFVGAGAGAGLWVAYKILGWMDATKAAKWAFPNNYEQLLVAPDIGSVLGGIGLFLVWGAACVAAATLIVSRRDV
jgi:ABC-type transport system involved in multi-copper enzyme maturation permease subunit